MGALGVEIRLHEWQAAEPVPRDQAEQVAGLPAAEIARRLQALVTVAPTWGDRLVVRGTGRVGQLQVGTLLVDVRPRIGVGATIALIGWVHDARVTIAEDALGAGAASPHSLEQALAAALVSLARAILASEIHRAYIIRHETRLLPRGRPSFSHMSPATAHAGLPCTYHEISRATPPNALLCAGLHRCLPLLLGTSSEHDARRTVDAFSNLTPPAVPSEARFRAALDTLPDRWAGYRPALVLARYLLLGGSPEATAGAGGVRGWFLNMAELFELGVTRAVREWTNRRSLWVRPQPAHRDQIFDALARPYTGFRPDLEVVRDGRVAAIIDAKYKPYAEAGPAGAPRRTVDPDDLYQLAFYLAAAAKRDGPVPGAIVCPAAPDVPQISEAFRQLSVAGHRVDVIPLDLPRCVAFGSDVAFAAGLDELLGPAPTSAISP